MSMTTTEHDCMLSDTDCLPKAGLYEYVRLVAGASIDCANALLQDKCQVAINWNGGWHHASRCCCCCFKIHMFMFMLIVVVLLDHQPMVSVM